MGSIVELSDSEEIDSLVKAGAIEPVGEKAVAPVPEPEAVHASPEISEEPAHLVHGRPKIHAQSKK
jgi:hypothetical protein